MKPDGRRLCLVIWSFAGGKREAEAMAAAARERLEAFKVDTSAGIFRRQAVTACHVAADWAERTADLYAASGRQAVAESWRGFARALLALAVKTLAEVAA